MKLRRDHTATTIVLFEDPNLTPPGWVIKVNGRGMAGLTTITKTMAHLPLAYLAERPKKGLVIAFGVGTTFRSILTWGIDVTVVELVPSVIEALGDFFTDAPRVLADPNGHVVIDDGRRFLARSAGDFDVITIDPPPPLKAAASSLLYSKEFYALVRSRLRQGGILQTWIPFGDFATMRTMLRTMLESFPHLHIHAAQSDPALPNFGLHVTASMSPLVAPDTETFIRRMPAAAQRDLMEWITDVDLHAEVGERILGSRVSAKDLGVGAGPILTDDHPVNEYFLLSAWRQSL